MKIINVTNDSFSEKGLMKEFSDNEYKELAENIINHDNIIDIFDLGAESSRPGSLAISSDEELSRLSPLLEILDKNKFSKPISIDTRKSSVINEVIKYSNLNISIVNDVSGGRYDNKIIEVSEKNKLCYLCMHSRGEPETMLNKEYTLYNNLLDEVMSEINLIINKCKSSNLNDWNLIIDPGIGFSKDKASNIKILNNINFLKQSYPVLIGASKKRFMGEYSNCNISNSIISANAIINGVDILRIHNPEKQIDAIKFACYYRDCMK